MPRAGQNRNIGYKTEHHVLIERAGTHLVLMLHGTASQEHDLLSLAAHLPQEGFTYASMRAPQPVGTQFSADSTGAYIAADAIGYQWYPLNQQLESDQRAIEQASDYVLEWVRANREQYASVTLAGLLAGYGHRNFDGASRPRRVRRRSGTVRLCGRF